jgi:hypothetical protein
VAVVSIEDRNRHTANQLLNAAMNYARLILRKYGEISPFGFSMSREGEVARMTLDLPRLPGDPARLWKLLSDQVAERVQRGSFKAVLMGANVSLSEPSAEGYRDGVLLEIEEETGYAVEVTIPYKILGGQLWGVMPRRIALGNMVAEESVCRFFRGGTGRKS